MLRLSVLIPALNEQATLRSVVEAVLRTGRAHEVIVIDDGSADRTPAVLEELVRAHGGLVRAARHAHPRGKGAAIRTGLALVTGNLVLVQDADQEYDPIEYPALLAPFDDPRVLVVYGSRNLHPSNPRSSFSFYWGGRFLSWVANRLFGSRLTDESTGYKLVRTDVLRELDLRTDGFEFCPELTGRLLRRGIAIHEVPISYRPRSYAQGKKVRWRDGAIAVRVLVGERLRPTDARAVRTASSATSVDLPNPEVDSTRLQTVGPVSDWSKARSTSGNALECDEPPSACGSFPGPTP